MHNNEKLYMLPLQMWLVLAVVWPPFIVRSILGSSGSQADLVETSLFRQVVFLVILLASAIALWRDHQATNTLIRTVNPWLWLFLMYVASSAVWSADVVLSIKRTALLMGTVSVSLAFVSSSRWEVSSKHRFFSTARPLITTLILVSFAYSLILPQLGTSPEGAWRGLTYNKNMFGNVAALSCVLWVIALRENAVNLGLGVLLFGVSLLAVLLSKSTTSLVVLAAVLCFLVLLTSTTSLSRSFRGTLEGPGYGTVSLLAILGLILVGHIFGVVIGYSAPIDLMQNVTGFLGKDLTLTGRTHLWQLLWDEIMRHPWLGTGYQAFWDNLDVSSTLRSAFTGGKGQGHNGYLDTFNELGIFGVALMLALLMSHAFNLLRLYRIYPREAEGHTLIFFCALPLNFSETLLFQPVGLWTLVVIVSIVEVSAMLPNRR